jgi:hypothetical protein
MLFQRRKMPITDNLSRSHDSDPELVIILLRHASDAVVDLANWAAFHGRYCLTTARICRSRFA